MNVIPEHIDWKENVMVDGSDVWLGIGRLSGSWFAFHQKPYFCLEGADRLYVIDLASRARLPCSRAALPLRLKP
jgi:hypothetical protein